MNMVRLDFGARKGLPEKLLESGCGMRQDLKAMEETRRSTSVKQAYAFTKYDRFNARH